MHGLESTTTRSHSKILTSFPSNRDGKTLLTVIDEAHLMDIEILRKLRLMFDEFPKNHNIILFGQTNILSGMSLNVNSDIKSRITFSATLAVPAS
ncbi:MAG: hypothetical protein A2293_17135 [Elusimicrobia bacterium RIFOXYB2_FULL_49_7]|nr:MAG: hypothetical protein A2293_17135 [Elusimicrobia bacterium RIFOXYB2_FULL_49_7]